MWSWVLVEYPCKCRHSYYYYYDYYSATIFVFPGEDLTEQEDTLDQEITSQKSESEEGVPTEDPPLRTEPQDNEDTCIASQQGSNNQHKDMDKDGE